MGSKLTPEVAALIDRTGDDDWLEVIVELEPDQKSEAGLETKSRTEKIAALKEEFLQNISPLEETVRKLGGEITGRAWINRSVRVRVPARNIKELAKVGGVAILDVPHRLTAG